jgi:chromosomal replication initiation ATPase DnaA
MATQLPLGLPVRAAMGRSDFFVSPANAAAVALVDRWPNWASYGAVLCGAPGSGKTHLAEVFAERSHAAKMEAADLRTEGIPELLVAPAMIVENISDGRFDESAMFHLLNSVRQEKKTVLLTSRIEPSKLNVTLPDLRSRLRALPSVRILAPDDELLRAVLLKNFYDRQLAVSELVLDYIIHRMPRSLDAARETVAAIDTAAMAERAEISRPFVVRVMSRMVNPELFGDT